MPQALDGCTLDGCTLDGCTLDGCTLDCFLFCLCKAFRLAADTHCIERRLVRVAVRDVEPDADEEWASDFALFSNELKLAWWAGRVPEGGGGGRARALRALGRFLMLKFAAVKTIS